MPLNFSHRYRIHIKTLTIMTTLILAQTGKWWEDSCSWARHKCKWACWCHVQTQTHMHSKHLLPHSTKAAAFNPTDRCNYRMTWAVNVRTWIWDVAKVKWLARSGVERPRLCPNISVMEEFEHSQPTRRMNRQTGRGDTSLSHRIRASNHFITHFVSQG